MEKLVLRLLTHIVGKNLGSSAGACCRNEFWVVGWCMLSERILGRRLVHVVGTNLGSSAGACCGNEQGTSACMLASVSIIL